MADQPDKVPGRAVAADPDLDQPEDMVHIVVLNGSITADWDTGPWRGEGTSRFVGGFGHSTY